MFSPTVMWSKSALFWKSIPMRFRISWSCSSEASVTRASPTSMVPRSGRISAVIILSRTLLPLAPGPMSP